ncbi:L,D-transpeptidase family protein [Flavobacterium seoulense]|uniref:L,D-transpeptidase YcbB n=1 Tax=Flavobacterium seoulense TaxID=1492738 RepID=A0A066WMG6_9FLAO|nr:L,D-transpeptidase family protein [Flavobacterium seoulense]KDN55051.1 l,D-transpeptidase YcbB [Flavobacterium seoulense]
MKKTLFAFSIITMFIISSLFSCKNKSEENQVIKPEIVIEEYQKTFDSTMVTSFFKNHPLFQQYEADVKKLYQKHNFHYVWFDKKGINEFANLLYDKTNNLEDEGVANNVPYKTKLDSIHNNLNGNSKPNIETELLHSSLYFFYVTNVYHGLDSEKSKEAEWYIPRKQQSYISYLDSLLSNPSLINKEDKNLFSQYFLLKKALKKYRKIEKQGGWNSITIDTAVTSYKIGDSATAIAQIRERLFISDDIKSDSKSAIYDKELSKGVLHYKLRRGYLSNSTISKELIRDLNIPISERIKTIMINMERCRWVSSDIPKSKELIAINIPSFQLSYFKNQEVVLRSKVVVGKTMNKTVIFSAPMKYIVFSPYWNIPASIKKNEILPGIAKNPNYLAEHNMEWNGNSIRQKPGPKNSLGLIKFLFPNSNDIYLHDTPSKGLFERETRAFSHGCIRVAKPKELAMEILKDNPEWTPEKIDSAMHKGKETWYTLKEKIPVYIGYFTAWVDNDGTINFYNDIYKRDELLANLLFKQ